LLQAGFDLGMPTDNLNGSISWLSRTLYKDNDTRNDYYGGELAELLGYTSVSEWHPGSVQRDQGYAWVAQDNAVSLAPREADEFFCAQAGNASRVEYYKIEGVPFHYAVPVLTGWELGYLCADHHVRQIAAAISDFSYVRDANASSGTLYYTLATSLTDDSNYSYANARVDVLGLQGVGPGPFPVLGPSDDVPRGPASCTFNNQTVADGMSVNAYASPTTVVCEACERETRTCHDGALSGSYAYASCIAKKPKPPAECP
jgi:hypothetical protein